jgi:hypothetical protein
MTRRGAVLAGAILIATLLAFPLRQAVHQTIIVPAAYMLWALGLFYRSQSQGIWWVLLVVSVLFILGRSLAPQLQLPARASVRPNETRGQVQDLARWLERAKKGTYFKWLVANRLGKLAYQILLQRGNGKPRSVFEPLSGPDWEPGAELQSYFQSGLQRSFADFPTPRKLLASPPKTALDHDVDKAVEFLEVQLDHSH